MRFYAFLLTVLAVPLLLHGEEYSPIKAIPTFECMSLEWNSPKGSSDAKCTVAYRDMSAAPGEWREGHELWFDAFEKQYRGSVVSLKPGTLYEFKLALPGGSTVSVTQSTWSDRFPIGEVETLPSGILLQPLRIAKDGDQTGYRLIQAHPLGTTINVQDVHDHCVEIAADRVILRGVKCINARVHGVFIKGNKDVVIEACDISSWGRPETSNDPKKIERLGAQMDSGIFCEGAGAERIVLQGNRIHHPRYTSNDWSQWSPFFKSNHPQGPKAVVFKPQTRGNHVIRFNECVSDDEHLFNDILLESNPGWPGNGICRDSDIYGNILSHATDDAIEIERGTRNVRVWENYFDRAGIKTLSVRPSWEGPYYIFRNVVDRVFVPKGSTVYNGKDIPIGMFVVGGGRGPQGRSAEPRERGLGYIYHNTLLCRQGAGFERFLVADFPQGLTSPELWFKSRNNIATTRPLRSVQNVPINDFFGERVVSDFDLLAGPVDRPATGGQSNVYREPIYRTGHGSGASGLYQLAEQSPGRNMGEPIPNFSGPLSGNKIDIGACQSGSAPMVFGTKRFVSAANTLDLGFEQTEDKLLIRWKDNIVGEYVFCDTKIPRPYFAQLKTLDGVLVSRNHPPRKDRDATDHDRLHPGLWLAFGDINGTDFWRNQGRVEQVRFLNPPMIQNGRLHFSVELRYLNAKGEEVCVGVNDYCLIIGTLSDQQTNGTILLMRTILKSDTKNLTFGPQHEMGLGFRVATPITVQSGSGRILSSHGGVNEKGNWGLDGQWWDYSGMQSSSRTGILVVASSQNTRPVWAHARDYGFLAMNPTGAPPDAKDVPSKAFAIAKGESFSMLFGALMYAAPDSSEKETQARATIVVDSIDQWAKEFAIVK